MRKRIWTIGLLVALIAAVLLYATAAAGQGVPTPEKRVVVSVPITNVVHGKPGEVKPAREPVTAAELGIAVGQECLVGLRGENPGSEHPGNDQILSTNGQSLVAANFEEFKGKITMVSTVMTIGESVTFDIRIGEDGVSSGGLTATFDCPPPEEPPSTTTTTSTPEPPNPPPSSTTTSTTPSVTTSTTPLPVTTTTTPPPINGIDTGGGACADGACDGFRLTPPVTWGLLLAALAIVLAGAVGWNHKAHPPAPRSPHLGDGNE
jgi:hypothetical protein